MRKELRKPRGAKRRHHRGLRDEKRVFRLHVEGKITEREYFQCIKSRDVHLSFARSAGLDPKSLVRNARDDMKKRRRRRSHGDFDELWCVFDVDEHERLAEALSDARTSGLDVVVSNPCFELWLVLHASDQSALISRSQIQQRCERIGLTDGKHLANGACNRLKENTLEAKHRAIELGNSPVATGISELENPSSSVWRLVDRLQTSTQK